MNQPVLVIMAAGMGSRYGGCKQIDPMDDYGNLIIDFSICDALKAGFKDVVFIIKHEIEADFREAIGNRIANYANVSYVFQELKSIPAGLKVPEGRVKPWGTTHAIICAADAVGNRPMAAINADDYYGPQAYQLIYDFLAQDADSNEHALVGYRLGNTLTDYGFVARGVCDVGADGYLSYIVERKKIKKTEHGCAYADEQDEAQLTPLSLDATTSMNFWGFNPGILPKLEAHFSRGLAVALAEDPLTYENYLPNAVQAICAENEGRVRVLPTLDRWFGVTYQQDKPGVIANIQEMKRLGVYSQKLWD